MLTSSVLRHVVLDRVITTMPILRFVAIRLPSLFFWLVVIYLSCSSLFVRSKSMRLVLRNARSTFLSSLQWPALPPLFSDVHYRPFFHFRWTFVGGLIAEELTYSVLFHYASGNWMFCVTTPCPVLHNLYDMCFYLYVGNQLDTILTLSFPWPDHELGDIPWYPASTGFCSPRSISNVLLMSVIFSSSAQSAHLFPTHTLRPFLRLRCQT